MADRIFDSSWVDRYVLNELSHDEALAFEAALFDSEALRSDVEAALSLQSILSLDEETSTEALSSSEQAPRRAQPWQPLAMAASLVVGVFGFAMWLTSSSEISDLRERLTELSQGASEIVIKRIDVTRSSSTASGTPVLKPDGNALLVLDIELSSRTENLDQVRINLIHENDNVLSSWSGDTTDLDRVSLGVRASQLPEGSLSLEFHRADGELLEKRRIEIIANE